MKKLTIVCLLLTALMTSCYEDYIKDFDHTSIYFMYQTNVRTFVVGEGMKIEVGAALGGTRANTRDRVVNYTFDETLLNASTLAAMKTGAGYIKDAIAPVTQLKMLPASYFTISDNAKMVIKSGEHSGSVVIKADSAKFLADAATISPVYALPFYIKTADADSLLPDKRYAVVALKYEAMLYGNYWHGGVTTVKDATGKVVKTTNYFTTIPSPESKVMVLKTVGTHSLTTSKISDQSGSMIITLQGGKVVVSSAPGSKVIVENDGESTYNQAKLLQDRKIFLKYKFANADGTTSYAQDTLTFRNRIRDGVNEWMDSDPAKYK